MTVIRLETFIQAPIGYCFDLSLSAEAHLGSMAHTGERVISGRRHGTFNAGERVTWEAVHFGIKQQLSVEITIVQPPHLFEDRMTKGAFKSMRHEHHFSEVNDGTLMKDVFSYEVPYSVIGSIFDWLVLRRYMANLLRQRNGTIKRLAEEYFQ